MNKILRKLLAVGALLAGALPLMYAQAPKHEMRGAWVATVYGIDWPSVQGATPEIAEQQKAELTTLIDTLQTAGLNAIFLQVRPMADAIYASDKEPWSSYLTGRRGTAPADGWDPLAFAVEEAHARGMELHAWVNPLRFAASSASLPST
ncbi:MAG TPA: cell surface protein, partial [Porphyromonadaceae bacterium]|nr:cell surface protein [Porphyromonadaceae bacterium]